MKITRSDSGQLVIVDFPWVLGVMLFGACGVLTTKLVRLLYSGPISTRDSAVYVLGSGLFFLGGAHVAQRSRFIFDRLQRQLTWSRLGILGRKGGVIPFDQIECVLVQVISSNTASSRNLSLDYRLALKTRSGVIPFSDSYRAGSEAKCRVLRTEINRFLGLPQEDEDASGQRHLQELVKSGQLIEAIKLIRAQRGCGLAEAKQIVDEMRKQLHGP